MVAPITNGDMDFQLARIVGDRLQRHLVDGEAELVEPADGPLDAVAVGEAEHRLGVQHVPQRLVPIAQMLGFGDQRVLQLLRPPEPLGEIDHVPSRRSPP